MPPRLPLYTFLFTLVLLLVGCGNEETTNPGSESRPAEASAGINPAAGDEDQISGARAVLFLGDSITAGYGIDPNAAFPALLQSRVDAAGLPFALINGGLSGETSAGGLRRIGWLLQQPIDLLVLELGGNDGLRGVDLDDTRRNLQGIIDTVRSRNSDTRIIVAGMMIPPNLGIDYTEEFRAMFPALATQNDAALIPFLLDGVGGVDSLMQSDGIHPTAAGHRRIAETVWPVLEPELRSITDSEIK